MQSLVICAKDWPHVRKCVQVSEKERTMWSTSGTEDKEAHVVKWRSHANSVEIPLHSKLPSMRLLADNDNDNDTLNKSLPTQSVNLALRT